MERVSPEKLQNNSIATVRKKVKVTCDIRRPLPFEPRSFG